MAQAHGVLPSSGGRTISSRSRWTPWACAAGGYSRHPVFLPTPPTARAGWAPPPSQRQPGPPGALRPRDLHDPRDRQPPDRASSLTPAPRSGLAAAGPRGRLRARGSARATHPALHTPHRTSPSSNSSSSTRTDEGILDDLDALHDRRLIPDIGPGEAPCRPTTESHGRPDHLACGSLSFPLSRGPCDRSFRRVRRHVHGRVALMMTLARAWQRQTGHRLDAVLQVGDMGAFPDSTRLDCSTARFARDASRTSSASARSWSHRTTARPCSPRPTARRSVLPAATTRTSSTSRPTTARTRSIPAKAVVRAGRLRVRPRRGPDCRVRRRRPARSRPPRAGGPPGELDGRPLDGSSTSGWGPRFHPSDLDRALRREFSARSTCCSPTPAPPTRPGIEGSEDLGRLARQWRPRAHLFGHHHRQVGPVETDDGLLVGLEHLEFLADGRIRPGSWGDPDPRAAAVVRVGPLGVPPVVRRADPLDLEGLLSPKSALQALQTSSRPTPGGRQALRTTSRPTRGARQALRTSSCPTRGARQALRRALVRHEEVGKRCGRALLRHEEVGKRCGRALVRHEEVGKPCPAELAPAGQPDRQQLPILVRHAPHRGHRRGIGGRAGQDPVRVGPDVLFGVERDVGGRVVAIQRGRGVTQSQNWVTNPDPKLSQVTTGASTQIAGRFLPVSSGGLPPSPVQPATTTSQIADFTTAPP